MFWWNSMDTGRSRAGKNSQMKMVWVPRIQLWKEEKKYTFLLKTRWEKLYILMKHYKERSKACCLQFLFFFFLQQNLEILHYYTHLFQILSGLVPRRGNTLSEKSSHQQPLDAVQLRGVFGAEHMQMLTDTRILSLPEWQEHSWSLQEEMAITERTVYFAGRWFAQSQQTITLESLFSCTELYVLTVPLGDSLLSTEQKALTTRKRKKERKSTHLLTLILFLLISEQMVTYHNGSFIKISIF